MGLRFTALCILMWVCFISGSVCLASSYDCGYFVSNISESTLSGRPGDRLHLITTISNTATQGDVWFSISSISPGYLEPCPVTWTFFDFGSPLVLRQGESKRMEICAIDIDATAPIGEYPIDLDFYGGIYKDYPQPSEMFYGGEWRDFRPYITYQISDRQLYRMQVVTEPSCMAAMLCGLMGIGGTILRRRR